MWKFRGSPHYIDRQADRLGVSKVLADRARHSAEIYRVSVLIGQLCERYHRLPKADGRAIVPANELAQIKAMLGQCEQEMEKLHVLAAASEAMVAEAYEAFGLGVPHRSFLVACDFDKFDQQEA